MDFGGFVGAKLFRRMFILVLDMFVYLVHKIIYFGIKAISNDQICCNILT